MLARCNPDLSFGGGAGFGQTDLGGDEGARALVVKNNKAIAAGKGDTRGTDGFARAPLHAERTLI